MTNLAHKQKKNTRAENLDYANAKLQTKTRKVKPELRTLRNHEISRNVLQADEHLSQHVESDDEHALRQIIDNDGHQASNCRKLQVI